MSDLKDLFKGQGQKKIFVAKSTKEIGDNAESDRNAYAVAQAQHRYVPPIDYSSPANFVKFGSAEEYYEASIRRVYEDYPYDGSLYEKQAWLNSSSYLDLYIFNELYPRTTGYAIFSPDNEGDGWGTKAATIGDYDKSSDLEYILVKGGPNADADNNAVRNSFIEIQDRTSTRKGANFFNLSDKRGSNLEINGATGNTVEFWLKKSEFLSSINGGGFETIFDCFTTSSISSSVNYGRLRVEVSGNTNSSPLYVTCMSGTNGFWRVPIGSITTTSMADNTWQHYAVTIKNTGSLGSLQTFPPVDTTQASGGGLQPDMKAVEVSLYVDGRYNQSLFTGSTIDYVSGAMVANVGALVASPSGTEGGTYNTAVGEDMELMRGYGKLSGSLDELRFWKSSRDAKQVGLNYNGAIGAGTNVDLANTDLGVYFKFNEGITGATSLDSIVLDFSGRVSNGTWTGYTATARNTGSAIVESSASITEFKDPIMYRAHPEVGNLITAKTGEGQVYDFENAASLYNSLPEWIISEDDETGKNLLKLTQIMANYFDDVSAQIKYLPRLQDKTYVSASISGSQQKAFPYNEKVLQGKGFLTTEMFADASVLEQFMNQNDFIRFSDKLSNVKNLIYKNIYNNLTDIYKAKGTEKSIRNLIRCFGIDEEIVKLNVYTHNNTHEFDKNVNLRTKKKKFVDFSTQDNWGATMYQYKLSSATTTGFISASQYPAETFLENGMAQTYECEFLLPNQLSIYYSGSSANALYPYLSSSVFGIHQVGDTSDGTETRWPTGYATTDYANFQVYVAREKENSQNVKFILSASNAAMPGLTTLTSSYFKDQYENQKWNIAVRVVPKSYPYRDTVDGSEDANGYKYEFYGVSYDGYVKTNSFYLTASVAESYGDEFLKNPKRLYTGAYRTDFTGSLLNHTDLKIGSTRAWFDYVQNDEIDAHASDITNFGRFYPYESAYLFENSSSAVPIAPVFQGNNQYVPKSATLLLNWDFSTVTSSNASGRFQIEDFSSGSIPMTKRYRWLGNVLGYNQTGRGGFFATSNSNVVGNQYISNAKQSLPEEIDSSDMVTILERDDIEFTRETRPTTYQFSLEKSMYRAISEEMINFFATLKDFNSLIGHGVNRYRQDYKTLGKLRQLFFEKIDNDPDIDKYLSYYRWIDNAIGYMVEQLFPASAGKSSGLRTIVESHVLERNKYWNKYPMLDYYIGGKGSAAKLETKQPDNISEASNNGTAWGENHATVEASPTEGSQNTNPVWWKTAADPTKISAISSGNTSVDETREALRRVMFNPMGGRHSSNIPKKSSNQEAENLLSKRGGLSALNKDVVLHAGATNLKKEQTLEAPSVRDATLSVNSINLIDYQEPDSTPEPDEETPGWTPINLIPKVQVFPSVDSRLWGSKRSRMPNSFPSLYSSSQGLIFTNIQQDVAATIETPLQGPFARQNEGGFLNRKQPVASGSQNNYSRPERFRISGPASFLSASVAASRDDVLSLAGSSDNDKFTVNVPSAVGGAGTDITIKMVAGTPSAGTANQVEFSSAGTAAAIRARIIIAIGGGTPSPSNSVAYGAGSGDATNGVAGITAEAGSTTNKFKVTATAPGAAGNDITFTDVVGTFVAGGTGASPATLAGGIGADVSIYEPRKTKSGTLNLDLARSDINLGTKRPVVIKNLKTATGSAQQKTTVIGNFSRNTDVVSSNSRTANNRWFVHNSEDLASQTPEVAFLTGNLNFELPSRPKTESIIVNRCASPGGFEISSRGYMNTPSEEYSVYNALPYKNQTVIASSGSDGANDNNKMAIDVHTEIHTRDDGLNVLTARHCGKFGIDSEFGSIQADNYDTTASWQQVNRNTHRIMKFGNAAMDVLSEFNPNRYVTASVYDNLFMNVSIPRSELQYAWITSSISGANVGTHPLVGYTSNSRYYDGTVSGAAGIAGWSSPIKFLTASSLGSALFTPGRVYGPDVNSGLTGFLANDFVGLNSNIYEPITSSTNTRGYPSQNIASSTDFNYRGGLLYSLSSNPSYTAISGSKLLNGLIHHRQGPYGWPTWKQIRGHDNPIVREQRKNNTIDILVTRPLPSGPRPQGSYYAGELKENTLKYARDIKKFTVPPASSKFKPMTHQLQDNMNNIVELRDTYGNNLDFMTNAEMDLRLGVPTNQEQVHDVIVDRVANNTDVTLNSFTYRETVYPREENTYLAKVRGRLEFVEESGSAAFNRTLGTQNTFWRSRGVTDLPLLAPLFPNAPSYRVRNNNMAKNSMGTTLSQYVGSASLNYFLSGDVPKNDRMAMWKLGLSAWPLDSNQWFTGTGSFPYILRQYPNGELYNSMWRQWLRATATSSFPYTYGASGQYADGGWQGPLTASQSYIYFNNWAILYSSSAGALRGDPAFNTIKYPGLFLKQGITNPSVSSTIPSGGFWNADVMSDNAPWHDTYEDYASDIRTFGKNYSVVPEFRISEHMDHYIDNGFSFNNRFLTLNGTAVSASADTPTSSYNENFFQIYSNTDFMKHFGEFKEENNKVNKITLTCEGVKKLLPYNGFYPVLRSVQLGSELSRSFGENISGSSLTKTGSYDAERLISLMQPFFAPGILYNSIKSGIAVDWPTVTGSLGSGTLGPNVDDANASTGLGYLSGAGGLFNYRLPFEALVDPSRYLPPSASDGSSAIYMQYPHRPTASLYGPTTDNSFFDWNGENKLNYPLAMNNFLAEIPQFFLNNSRFVNLTSKPERTFKSMQSGSTYYMDVELRKSSDFVMSEGLTDIVVLETTGSDDMRTYVTGSRNYRGTFFGPPCQFVSSSEVSHPLKPPGYYAESINVTDPAFAPFTPPYFYGSAVARVAFTPHQHEALLENETKFFTLDEILAGCKIETIFTSSANDDTEWLRRATDNGHTAGLSQMRLTSSVNLFGKTSVKKVTYEAGETSGDEFVASTAEDASDSSYDVWTISPKFECPTLNFTQSANNNLSQYIAETGETPYSSGSQATTIWGQYGYVPSGSAGIFLGIKESFPDKVNTLESTNTGSLLDVCGFEGTKKRVGELASKKEIGECVVAIPFVQKKGKRKFFPLLKSQIKYVRGIANKREIERLETTNRIPGDSIVHMVETMEKYVIPPHLDFLTDTKISPFAMYMFEFTHDLDREDLSDIWQNLMPKIAKTAEKQSVSISHEMTSNEFFGGKAPPAETQWMIFKVKRRAASNYYAATADSTDDDRFAFQFEVGGEKKTPNYSYNWPYDFFSLVELAKVDTEIEFTKKDNSE